MSPFAALRARRSADGLPPTPSDEELLAWSDALVSAEPTPEPATRSRRAQPLRAARAATVDGDDVRLSTEELLVEIERRAMAVSPRRRLVLRSA